MGEWTPFQDVDPVLQERYRSKFITLDEALGMIHSHDTISIGFFGNEPYAMMSNLHRIADRVEDVVVWTCNPMEAHPFIRDDSLTGRIDVISMFYGGSVRGDYKKGHVTFMPNNLHSMADVMMRTRKPNIFFAAVTPMDRFGYVCLSMSQQTEIEMLDVCDTVIFEVNPNMPLTGGTVRVPIDKVDYFIDVDYPISKAPEYPVTEAQLKIAGYASELIRDGDTIQLGIGGMPDAVAMNLRDRHDLGIYTEMIGSAMGKLMQCGAVNNSRKNFHRNRTVGAFLWGDQGLYDYANMNPIIDILPIMYVNDPINVMKNDNMVSVNTALEIDLTGQVCSETIGGRQYSGTGGASDFAYGAYHAKNGRGILALQSTAKSGTISRIKAQLTPGSVVSISRNIVDYVVTEYGVARLRDKTVLQRVDALIAIAHPDFRAELRAEAERLHIW